MNTATAQTAMTAANMTAIHNAARACAQGWAEQSREHDVRRWTGLVPQADCDYLEMEILGRPADEEEAAEFSRIFIDEYAACMEQRASRLGWDG